MYRRFMCTLQSSLRLWRLWAKGIGELPHDGPAPAILNAIRNATGLACNAIPLLPEDMLAKLSEVAAMQKDVIR